MGTWMSHLRVAERLLDEIPGLDERAFVYGNVAPDSGVPNEDWSVFDPPKEVTHYLERGEDESRIRDMDFWRDHMPAELVLDRPAHSFLLGYFVHLLCDNLWIKYIVPPARIAFADLLAVEGGNAWRIMKEDWYGQDQLYARDNPDSVFWRIFMVDPRPPSYVPFLSDAALHLQQEFIRRFYSQPDPEWDLDRAYPYLNAATMARFVDASTRVIVKIYAGRDQLADLAGDTALALLPPADIAPFSLPLGD